MKKYFALSVLLCSILISSCCLRGRDDQTFLLSSAVKDALPYTDAQEVVFVSNSGDTLKTKVQLSNEFYAPSCAECYCDSYKYENRSFTLVKDNNTAVALIVANAGSAPDQVDFILDGGYFALPFYPNSEIACDTTFQISTITCYDSMVIQNHIYQKVFEVNIQNVADTTTSRILYNTDKGLLRMEKKDGRFWEVL